MRLILAGQKSFGLAAYEAIVAAGHDVAAVWSPEGHMPKSAQWDRLTTAARRDGVWKYPGDRTPRAVLSQEVDLVVAAHSHDFISRPVRAATRLGGVGYHPSLLPRHRGRDAVRWTVHMGDPIAGGSVYWLTDNVDGGPVAAQEFCFVPRAEDLSATTTVTKTLWSDYLFPMGIRLLLRVLHDLDDRVIVEIPQEENHATWEPSWERPPLHRPDLPQIGGVNGYQHVTSASSGLTPSHRGHGGV